MTDFVLRTGSVELESLRAEESSLQYAIDYVRAEVDETLRSRRNTAFAYVTDEVQSDQRKM